MAAHYYRRIVTKDGYQNSVTYVEVTTVFKAVVDGCVAAMTVVEEQHQLV